MLKHPKLVAAYRLEGNANDWSGNGLHGTAYNVTYVAGKFGRGGDFNNTSSYISVPDNNLLDMKQGGWSICAWIKMNTLAPGTHPDWTDSVLIKGQDGTVGCYLLSLSVYGFNFYIRWSDSTLLGISAGTPSTGTWYHLCGTYDGTYMRMYINGSLAGTPVDVSTKTVGNSTESLYIGKTSNASFPYFFDGIIDEVMIFNKGLTSAEVRQVMLGFLPTEGATF